MVMKKILSLGCLWLALVIAFPVFADDTRGTPQQVIQINTKLHAIEGKPSWLIILRDVDTGQVLPYLYDIKNNDNYWLAFSLTHRYQVVSSYVKFGAFATISNFCHLENGILFKTSMFVTLTGDLTPNPRTSSCHVLKYKQDIFPIVSRNQ